MLRVWLRHEWECAIKMAVRQFAVCFLPSLSHSLSLCVERKKVFFRSNAKRREEEETIAYFQELFNTHDAASWLCNCVGVQLCVWLFVCLFARVIFVACNFNVYCSLLCKSCACPVQD